MSKDIVITVLNTQLVEHPKNMRRVYRLSDIAKMALSQANRAKGGKPPCTQPLIVTPGAGVFHYDSKSTRKLTVIAGHLRLRGNRYLGAQAPRLNCLVRFYNTEAEMLADMSTENGVRVDPGPVSWAFHFHSQLESGVNIRELARDSGKSVPTIRSLLELLDLGAEVQTLIDAGQLPIGAGEHLLKIGNTALQARLARRFVKRATPVAQMVTAVNGVLGQARQARGTTRKVGLRRQETAQPARFDDPTDKTPAGNVRKPRTEAEEHGDQAPALVGQPPELTAGLADLRQAAAAQCAACPLTAEHHQVEAAWHLARAATGQTCTACNMRAIKGACAACPLPAMLSRVVRQVAGRRVTAGQVVALIGVNA